MKTGGKAWFAARTRRGQELKVKESLESIGVEHFIPVRTVKRDRRDRKEEVPEAVIQNLVFLKAEKSDALSLVNGRGLPLYYIIDRCTRTLLEVPQKQMDDFIRVVTAVPESVCEDAPELHLGADVCIVRGELEGVEGKVLLLPNRTYVVVSVGSLLCAKVKIPRSYVREIR